MESEKVKEIKKVLEEGQFNTIKHHQHEGKPILISFADILTLIKELESENAELKKYKLDWLNSEKMHLQAEMEEAEFELYCVNKALKDRIAELEKEKVLCDGTNLEETEENNILEMFCKECKNKALKQFAERLKEEIVSMKWAREDTNEKLIKQGETIKAIDKTLKAELTEV